MDRLTKRLVDVIVEVSRLQHLTSAFFIAKRARTTGGTPQSAVASRTPTTGSSVLPTSSAVPSAPVNAYGIMDPNHMEFLVPHNGTS